MPSVSQIEEFGIDASRLPNELLLAVFVFYVLLGPSLEFFQKIGQNGRPGRQEPPRSTSFDETSRMVPV